MKIHKLNTIILSKTTSIFLLMFCVLPCIAQTREEKLALANLTFSEASDLYNEQTLESYKAARGKFLAANLLYEEINVKSQNRGIALVAAGLVSDILGENNEALKFYDKALLFFRAIENKEWEATTLNNIGGIYNHLGENQKSLQFYNEALLLIRKFGDKRGEATTLTNIGGIYSDSGDRQKALKYFNQALLLYREINEKGGEATTLNGIGVIYDIEGDRQQALKFYNQSLKLYREAGDKRGEAATLNYIGLIYSDLGDKQQALQFYNKSLKLYREVGEKRGEAATITTIGGIYADLGEKQQALKFLNEACPIYQTIGDKNGEAVTLVNIGSVYSDSGNKQEALKFFNQALPLFREIGNKIGEAGTLNNIGGAYFDLSEKQQAAKFFKASLLLSQVVGNKSGEAKTLNNLMGVWESQNNRTLAIFYGKQSVNAYQQLRTYIKTLDQQNQKTFLKSIEFVYRKLVNIMIAENRLSESLQILNSFKDQQFFDFDQSQIKQPLLVALAPREADFKMRYEKTSERVSLIGSLIEELKRTIGNRQSNAKETEQLKKLDSDLKIASDEFLAVIKQAEIEFSKPAENGDKIGEVSDLTKMQAALRSLYQQTGQKAVAIYQNVGEENFSALLITENGIEKVSMPVKGAELNKKAIEFFRKLNEIDVQKKMPKFSQAEVQKTGKELYDIVFAPVDAKLKEIELKPDVLMWSLDGSLRYLPVATLYDGKQYLAERYSNVVLTRANSERMSAHVTPMWTGLGFYSSKEYSLPINGKMISFSKLENAKTEVETIFGTKQKSRIIDGDFLPDEQFTKESFFKALKLNRPLVHIASHFRFVAGDASSSFLLLGDGTKLTLEEIKNAPNDLFKGVELLTLSACETGVQQERESDGREIDGFAELSQRKGAMSILASLWKVDDESTSQLMAHFYKTRQTQKLTKAEALQRGQLSLLKSWKFSHPYYWSPFILIGNWR